MIGVIGNILISYQIGEDNYKDIINPMTTKYFALSKCDQIKFKIEEVLFIEDTVYSVVLSMLEPYFKEDEFIIDNKSSEFEVHELDIKGKISLYFKGE